MSLTKEAEEAIIAETLRKLEDEKIKLLRIPAIVERLAPIVKHPMPASKAFLLSYGKRQGVGFKYSTNLRMSAGTRKAIEAALDEVLMEHRYIDYPMSVIHDLDDFKVSMFILEQFVHVARVKLDRNIDDYCLTIS